MSILSYKFMQEALLAGLLAGVACSLIGVFVVTMHLSFIGVSLSHAAFAGALFATWLGFEPLLGAILFSLAGAAAIGPLADRGEFNLDTPIGIIFSITMGLAFLFMGLLPGPKTQALELLWGSILTVTTADLWLLAVVTIIVTGLVVMFFKEIQVVIFHREMARAVGIPADAIFYSILFLTGATVTASLRSIGGLLIFNLILNPAAAAYQLTYSLKYMFFLAALFGVLSCWAGLGVSYILDVPSGAAIVLTSAVIFVLATIFSPKRKVKQWQENE
ncbi:ABC-3 [Moorella glycerini]|uniref:Manganese transport system membrane protein MntB n=1 Tax=Neomoorella stamsii TaxID=1266720 RepID=A0A9X7P556_9FIRM|nr:MULTISPECIES: metal ABC transporter permease [Moorella]PRR70374.1 Manganese transport system membrane protein MntB [Moorella stamsii]CEP66379.1 ABC-3 [Moorella glycerini]